jgi:hypothetical protein
MVTEPEHSQEVSSIDRDVMRQAIELTMRRGGEQMSRTG